MSTQENNEEEIQEWLDQVHYGSCCSDEAEDCKNTEKTKEPSQEDSDRVNS